MKLVLTEDKKATESVLNEAQFLQKLRHRNIVSLVEVPDEEHVVYLILEYCERKDLHHYLQEKDHERRSIPQELAMQWFLNLAAATNVSALGWHRPKLRLGGVFPPNPTRLQARTQRNLTVFRIDPWSPADQAHVTLC